MEMGLLWYNDSLADFASKVQEAAEWYREKFRRRPNRCYVKSAWPRPVHEIGRSRTRTTLTPAADMRRENRLGGYWRLFRHDRSSRR